MRRALAFLAWLGFVFLVGGAIGWFLTDLWGW